MDAKLQRVIKNLFDVELANQVKQRVESIRIDSMRQWGTMSAGQTVAHCASGLEMALGEVKPRRALIGRVIGLAIKAKVVGNDEPFRRNTPTMAELVIKDERNLDEERTRLCSLIDKF
jgi:hypothetical protein